jgi:hypothetical protein
MSVTQTASEQLSEQDHVPVVASHAQLGFAQVPVQLPALQPMAAQLKLTGSSHPAAAHKFPRQQLGSLQPSLHCRPA